MVWEKVKKLDKLALLLIIGGVVGFIASFILTIDKIKILQDPTYVPFCNVNPIISCGSVMKTSQASIFGFANSLLGIAGFAGAVLLGLAITAGGKFQKWFWMLIELGAIAGLAFVCWLIFQSVYRIHSLCPFCMSVWAVTIPMFLYITVHNLESGNFPKLSKNNRYAKFVYEHHLDFLIGMYLIVITIILIQFWSYWRTLI